MKVIYCISWVLRLLIKYIVVSSSLLTLSDISRLCEFVHGSLSRRYHPLNFLVFHFLVNVKPVSIIGIDTCHHGACTYFILICPLLSRSVYNEHLTCQILKFFISNCSCYIFLSMCLLSFILVQSPEIWVSGFYW